MVCPVVAGIQGDSRATALRATAVASPASHPRGAAASQRWESSPKSGMAPAAVVLKGPDEMALTRTPRSPSSTARARIAASSAALRGPIQP